MNGSKQQMLVCALANQLIRAGNWCGETHLQKAIYVAKHWLGVSEFKDFEFILYMYGPFSFDLKGELRAMRADGLLESHFLPGMSYGPTLRLTKRAKKLIEQAKKPSDVRACEFGFIAKEFSGKNAADLERLATALLATRELGKKASVSERVRQLRTWKLHFTEREALQAVRNADDMLKRKDSGTSRLGGQL